MMIAQNSQKKKTTQYNKEKLNKTTLGLIKKGRNLTAMICSC